MAIPEVKIEQFTIATQADTINEIARLEGDLVNLTTESKDNLVNAINEVKSNITQSKRSILIYAIAMS